MEIADFRNSLDADRRVRTPPEVTSVSAMSMSDVGQRRLREADRAASAEASLVELQRLCRHEVMELTASLSDRLRSVEENNLETRRETSAATVRISAGLTDVKIACRNDLERLSSSLREVESKLSTEVGALSKAVVALEKAVPELENIATEKSSVQMKSLESAFGGYASACRLDMERLKAIMYALEQKRQEDMGQASGVMAGFSRALVEMQTVQRNEFEAFRNSLGEKSDQTRTEEMLAELRIELRDLSKVSKKHSNKLKRMCRDTRSKTRPVWNFEAYNLDSGSECVAACETLASRFLGGSGSTGAGSDGSSEGSISPAPSPRSAPESTSSSCS